MMSNVLDEFMEGYATATQSPRLYDTLIVERSTDSGKTAIRLSGRATSILGAAGMTRHWGCSLLRLKFGLDAGMYRDALRAVKSLAVATGERLHWNDPELTRFLAEEALHAWLLDRRIRGRSEWAGRCVTLRKRIDVESQKVAAAIASRLVMR